MCCHWLPRRAFGAHLSVGTAIAIGTTRHIPQTSGCTNFLLMQARCRSQAVVLDVPVHPVVQENEVMHDSPDAGSRKFGPKVMAEKVAGSGVFYRAFVKASKADRVLLYFPEDTGALTLLCGCYLQYCDQHPQAHV